jgi:hypothetical protein
MGPPNCVLGQALATHGGVTAAKRAGLPNLTRNNNPNRNNSPNSIVSGGLTYYPDAYTAFYQFKIINRNCPTCTDPLTDEQIPPILSGILHKNTLGSVDLNNPPPELLRLFSLADIRSNQGYYLNYHCSNDIPDLKKPGEPPKPQTTTDSQGNVYYSTKDQAFNEFNTARQLANVLQAEIVACVCNVNIPPSLIVITDPLHGYYFRYRCCGQNGVYDQLS